MNIPFQSTARDAPRYYAVHGATTVKPVGRIRFPNSPRMASSLGAYALTMRNLADSFCHFLFSKGKSSLRAMITPFLPGLRNKPASKSCAVPYVKITISGALPVTITGEHIACLKNGKKIPESRNGVSVDL